MKQNKNIFISYAKEDYKVAQQLYRDLKNAGAEPWIDVENLLPGQNWKTHITKAIKDAEYFLVLLSSNSVSKKGYVQKEIKIALDILDEFPDEEIFIIPARLDDCEPKNEKLKHLQWADLFPSYKSGLRNIMRVFFSKEKDVIDSPNKTDLYDPIDLDISFNDEPIVTNEYLKMETKTDHKLCIDFENLPVFIPALDFDDYKNNKKLFPDSPIDGKHKLRKIPIKQITGYNASKYLDLEDDLRPIVYINNEFEVRGEIIFDHKTDLVWQKGGSEVTMIYEEAIIYTETLNKKYWRGYDEWRIPTTAEVISLLEPLKTSDGLYLNKIFNKKQYSIWSSDQRDSGWALNVDFKQGKVDFGYLGWFFIKCVCSV